MDINLPTKKKNVNRVYCPKKIFFKPLTSDARLHTFCKLYFNLMSTKLCTHIIIFYGKNVCKQKSMSLHLSY